MLLPQSLAISVGKQFQAGYWQKYQCWCYAGF